MCLCDVTVLPKSDPEKRIGYKVLIKSDEDTFCSPVFGRQLYSIGPVFEDDRIDNIEVGYGAIYPSGYHIFKDFDRALSYYGSWIEQEQVFGDIGHIVLFEVEYSDVVAEGYDGEYGNTPAVAAKKMSLVRQLR